MPAPRGLRAGARLNRARRRARAVVKCRPHRDSLLRLLPPFGGFQFCHLAPLLTVWSFQTAPVSLWLRAPFAAASLSVTPPPCSAMLVPFTATSTLFPTKASVHLHWYNRGSGSLHPIAERAVAGPDLWHGTCIPVKAPVREAGLHDLVPCGSDGRRQRSAANCQSCIFAP